MAVHLHRDYSAAHCGEDISYLPATFDENSATCEACREGLAKYRAEQEAARLLVEEELRAEAERRAARVEFRKARVAHARQAHLENEARMRRIEEALALRGEP